VHSVIHAAVAAQHVKDMLDQAAKDSRAREARMARARRAHRADRRARVSLAHAIPRAREADPSER
jgi:hypothetical protein